MVCKDDTSPLSRKRENPCKDTPHTATHSDPHQSTLCFKQGGAVRKKADLSVENTSHGLAEGATKSSESEGGDTATLCGVNEDATKSRELESEETALSCGADIEDSTQASFPASQARPKSRRVMNLRLKPIKRRPSTQTVVPQTSEEADTVSKPPNAKISQSQLQSYKRKANYQVKNVQGCLQEVCRALSTSPTSLKGPFRSPPLTPLLNKPREFPSPDLSLPTSPQPKVDWNHLYEKDTCSYADLLAPMETGAEKCWSCEGKMSLYEADLSDRYCSECSESSQERLMLDCSPNVKRKKLPSESSEDTRPSPKSRRRSESWSTNRKELDSSSVTSDESLPLASASRSRLLESRSSSEDLPAMSFTQARRVSSLKKSSSREELGQMASSSSSQDDECSELPVFDCPGRTAGPPQQDCDLFGSSRPKGTLIRTYSSRTPNTMQLRRQRLRLVRKAAPKISASLSVDITSDTSVRKTGGCHYAGEECPDTQGRTTPPDSCSPTPELEAGSPPSGGGQSLASDAPDSPLSSESSQLSSPSDRSPSPPPLSVASSEASPDDKAIDKVTKATVVDLVDSSEEADSKSKSDEDITCCGTVTIGDRLGRLSEKDLKRQIRRLRPRLKDIFQGTVRNQRHDLFKKGPVERSNLAFQTRFSLISEEQHHVVVSTLTAMFCQQSMEYYDYVTRVLLPETLVMLVAQTSNITEERARSILDQ